MALKEQLRADRVQAMKDRDETAKNALGMALTAIQRAETQGEAHTLDDIEVLAILKKEVASRKDSAEAYAAGNRQDLVDKELSQAECLARYLPAPLTESELDAIVAEEAEKLRGDIGADLTMRDMGALVRAVNCRAEGRAEGKAVAAKVRAQLG